MPGPITERRARGVPDVCRLGWGSPNPNARGTRLVEKPLKAWTWGRGPGAVRFVGGFRLLCFLDTSVWLGKEE